MLASSGTLATSSSKRRCCHGNAMVCRWLWLLLYMYILSFGMEKEDRFQQAAMQTSELRAMKLL